ncbi:unnamed protein product [Urochloa humidicola]
MPRRRRRDDRRGDDATAGAGSKWLSALRVRWRRQRARGPPPPRRVRPRRRRIDAFSLNDRPHALLASTTPPFTPVSPSLAPPTVPTNPEGAGEEKDRSVPLLFHLCLACSRRCHHRATEFSMTKIGWRW